MLSFGIKAILGLIPIYLHFQKLSGRLQLRAHSLSCNHILKLLLKLNSSVSNTSHPLSLDVLTPKQRSMIKGLVINMDNRFNKVFHSFNPFNKEFSLDSHLIDIFHSHFLFHCSNKQSDQDIKSHIHLLNNITIKSLLDPSYAFVVSNASIKNNVAMSISHVHVYDKPIIKMIYHVVNITTTEAELFAIRCGIN